MKSETHIGRRHVIGLVVNTSLKPRRDVMLGWMRYVRDRDDIELRFFFANATTLPSDILEFAGSGVHALVLCGLQRSTVVNLIESGRLGMPIVVLCTYVSLDEKDMRFLMPNVGAVLLDNEAIGRLVGEFFLGHGLVAFGFLSMNLEYERDAGRVRCAAFRSVVMADGDKNKVFREKFFGVSKRNAGCWDEPLEELETWVKSLPLPCGVFANGDRSAYLLLDVCRRLGIDVPGQIEVLSVNNTQELCEGMESAVSSIQPNFDRCAQLSIEMALDIAGGGLAAEDRIVKVSDHALIERGSSLSGRNYGKIVTKAKEFIKKNACYGISVMDVAKHLGISRRTLEVRLKYATGCSVLELIRDVKLENICRLLETTDFTVTEIVTRSGYNLTSNVGVLFKKIYGMTMRQYRAVHRAK